MAKKDNAIYAPGELSNLRDKLGVTDQAEAKRMAQVLGGEVGVERGIETENAKNKKKDVTTGGRRGRRVDVAGDELDDRSARIRARTDVFPGDDPTVPAKLNYRERVKIDQLSGQLFFEIKTSFQVLISVFSFFREPVDYVSSRFVTKRMNEYYNKIERLVTALRNILPKNNTKRNNQLKRANPFVFKVLDTIRSWDIEKIASNIAQLQSHPRAVKASDFTEVLRLIYKPLYALSDLNIEHIKSAFKLLYKILYIESPMDAKEKYQDVIRNIIASVVEIRRDVQFGMYPLLMKLISDRFIPYERFFTERRRCFMAFLNVTASEQLSAAELNTQQIDSMDVETLQKNESDDEQINETEKLDVETVQEEEDPNDPKVIERKAKQEAERAERRALEQGKSALEALFPKVGWEKLDEHPDLYPYFANVYNMKHGFELISPTDPLQQTSILMHILDDLFIGMRYVTFGTIIGPDGKVIRLSEDMSEIANNWRVYIEDSFLKEYLPRLGEYCRMLENSEEGRSSIYAKKIMNELQWIRRLYFLPYYRFESVGPPPFTKQDIVPIYTQIRKLRKYLTSIAVGIEQGMRVGGAAAKAACDGIVNPWEAYNFQIPNPVSRRLDMMIPQERKINATLIFFSLSAVTVLDYLINNENSWFYSNHSGPFFRSVRDEGIIPIFGVDEKLDAEKIFKESLKKVNS
ncbi:MAG: hypothetical protein LBI04_10725 [Treponema sp.]|jgi:hypothetical protein|nr:hypothetical protein [Treponema sp.]